MSNVGANADDDQSTQINNLKAQLIAKDVEITQLTNDNAILDHRINDLLMDDKQSEIISLQQHDIDEQKAEITRLTNELNDSSFFKENIQLLKKCVEKDNEIAVLNEKLAKAEKRIKILEDDGKASWFKEAEQELLDNDDKL